MQRAQDGWVEKGRVMQRAIGAATLRPDGFVSLRAGAAGGELVTAVLGHPGGELSVNAAIEGRLRAALLDENGAALSGYALAQCTPISGDDLHHRMRWPGQDVDRLAGRKVRLQFALSECGDLFSFQFSER